MNKKIAVEEQIISDSTRALILSKALDIIGWSSNSKNHHQKNDRDKKYRNGAWFEGNDLMILYESKPSSANDILHLVMIYFKGNLVFHQNETGIKFFTFSPGWKEALWRLHRALLVNQQEK